MNNGRRHPQAVKIRARELRKNGYTHGEIAKVLGISRGSAHLWTTGIVLTSQQKEAIEQRRNQHIYTEQEKQMLRENLRKNAWPRNIKYTRDSLLQLIRTFYKKYGRIPLKREFNMWGEYKRHFQGWNDAIQTAGFEPNRVIFSKKCYARDGHICDSFVEKILDDWLFSKKVLHKKNVPYVGTKMTADFAIGNLRIEYFGLAKELDGYDETIEKKRTLCRDKGLRLLAIYPKDLFSSSRGFKKCLGGILRIVRSVV